MTRKTLAEQLRAEILGSELTRSGIADAARVDRGHMTRFLQGKCDLSLSRADAIAKVLDMELTRRERP